MVDKDTDGSKHLENRVQEAAVGDIYKAEGLLLQLWLQLWQRWWLNERNGCRSRYRGGNRSNAVVHGSAAVCRWCCNNWSPTKPRNKS